MVFIEPILTERLKKDISGFKAKYFGIQDEKNLLDVIITTKTNGNMDVIEKKIEKFSIGEIKEYSFINSLFFKIKKVDFDKIKKIRDIQGIYDGIGSIKHCLNESVPMIRSHDVIELPSIIPSTDVYLDGKGINVGIIDTGIDYHHPDFGDRIKEIVDFTNDNKKIDLNGHGTHVAGIIGGSGDLSDGKYKGIAPNINFYVAKALGSKGWGARTWILDAIQWIVKKRVDVVNMSLGNDSAANDGMSPETRAVDWAVEQGITFVTAVGNEGASPDGFMYGSGTVTPPGDTINGISVGAVDKSLKLADFSSRGPTSDGREKPDVVAPGVNICSTKLNGEYMPMSGTSMAAPHVTGTAALLIQLYKELYSRKVIHNILTPIDIKRAIKAGAIDLGFDGNSQGTGIVNIPASANWLQYKKFSSIKLTNKIEPKNVNEKIKKEFRGKIVRKDLVYTLQIERLPRYISEYLLTRFCENGITTKCTKKLQRFIKEYFPKDEDKNIIKKKLKDNGYCEIFDELRAFVDLEKNASFVSIPRIGISRARISDNLLNNYENLLRAGIWGIAHINYDPTDKIKLNVSDFIPYQVSQIDIEEYVAKRENFSKKEWINLLINTLGLNPRRFNHRKKVLILSRLLPLIEDRLFMIEVGPKGTGKSYLFENISFYSKVVAGGKISRANLFYNLNTKKTGLLCLRDCIVFDEINRIEFTDKDELMAMLKVYMANGFFTVGKTTFSSYASMMLLGNILIKNKIPAKKYYLDILPNAMQESAFYDRINGIIPGWEIDKIGDPRVYLSYNYGFISDYFSQIVHEFRNINLVSQYKITLDTESNSKDSIVSVRDVKSIKKIINGLLKILYPNANVSDNDLKELLNLAIEYRQRIYDQMSIIDEGEFPPKKIVGWIE